MRKAIGTLLALSVLGAGVYAYYGSRPPAVTFTIATAAISRGDVIETVGATGTLQAVTTVQVGTQVSGTIQSLYADFNSLVRKGQVLARLDPSLFQTQIEQARANLLRSQADLERLRVQLDDARAKLTRARELSARALLPKVDLETAEVNVRSAEAQIRSSEAQVVQAQASLNQNQVNLEHTVIAAPIDGLVISRNVDVGQTVAASMQAPTLFVLAADLTKMQVVANLDESDVGRIRPGQSVSFGVDAYPQETFAGSVSQVRLEPKVQQNVVTYATVIDVPNPALLLKPGMTANVTVEIARSANVLRVPNGALRFRPTTEIFALLGQTPPEPGQMRGEADGVKPGSQAAGRSRTPTPGAGESAAPPLKDAAPPPAGPSASRPAPTGPGTTPAGGRPLVPELRAPSAGEGGPGTGPGAAADDAATRRVRRTERLQALSPEERERMLVRMRERGGELAGPNESPTATHPAGATTVDALFGPLPRTESVGRVWLHVEKHLKPVRLRLGISDGQFTEVIAGDVQPGTEVVTNVTTPNSVRPAATAFPFGAQPGRGQPMVFPAGGGFQGGGQGAGRGR